MINGFEKLRRDVLLAVDTALFDGIAGSADSEVLFHLALTFGLEDEPLAAMERAIGFVEEMARERGVKEAVQMTVGISDGERLWAVRYSSARQSRTLFLSEDVDALRRLHPDNVRLQQLAEGDRVIVSEPLGDLAGAWIEVPESTGLVLEDGDYERRPFKPR
jgi:predicted glutamine amidotransferase